MSDGDGRPRVFVLVRPGSRASEIRRWLRALLPTAILVATPAALPPDGPYDLVTIDADATDPGPLSIADAIARDLQSRADASAEAVADATPAGGRR